MNLFKDLISNTSENGVSTKRFIILVCLTCIIAMVIANIAGVAVSIQIFWALCVLCASAAGLTLINQKQPTPPADIQNIKGFVTEVEKDSNKS